MIDWALVSNPSFLAIAAILLFGVPHGGLDGAIARRVGWPSGYFHWILFHAAYLILAAAVALLWWLYPLANLIFFLTISAFHFGSSDIRAIDAPTTPRAWLPLAAHGGLVAIAIPALQSAAVQPLFGVLIGADNARWLLAQIDYLLLPWAACVLLYALYSFYQPRWRLSVVNLVLLIGLAYALPPLVSFALYFCLWHSRTHMVRIWRSIAMEERARSARETIIYSALAYAAGALYLVVQSNSAAIDSELTPALLQLTFIGLAALTVPHMLLVDIIHGRREQQ